MKLNWLFPALAFAATAVVAVEPALPDGVKNTQPPGEKPLSPEQEIGRAHV